MPIAYCYCLGIAYCYCLLLLLRFIAIASVQGLGIAYCQCLLFNMIIVISYCYCLLLLPSRGGWGGAAPPSSVSFFYTFSNVFGVLCRNFFCFQSIALILSVLCCICYTFSNIFSILCRLYTCFVTYSAFSGVQGSIFNFFICSGARFGNRRGTQQQQQ